MIEKYLITHCSPTLASLKTANLMSVAYENLDSLNESIGKYNREISTKGVNLLLLKAEKNKALVYVYRKKQLCRDLNKAGVFSFLSQYGYASCDADICIERLTQRLRCSDEFPHEIGIFLGYPLTDVTAFIENSGRNSKFCGCWKVYCNENETVRLFEKFNKCRRVYHRLWLQGRSIAKLTVAA